MTIPELPHVSVILPIRNEINFIDAALGCVLNQDYPGEKLQILVVDGMSTDGTRESVEKLISEHGTGRIELLDNPDRIVPSALNRALQRAEGEVIIRVDGHCEIAPDYVRRCVELLRSEGVEGVGGPIDTLGETRTSKAIALAMSSFFGVGGSAFRTVKGRTMLTDSVAFPAYTRGAVEKAGLFDEELVRNQDDEYNYRIRKLGGKILLSPALRSKYYSRSSLTSLWRQYFQYGFWKVRVLQKHPLQMRLRQFVPPVFVSGLLVSPFIAVWAPVRPVAFLLPLLYAAANLFASLHTAAAQKGSPNQLPFMQAMLLLPAAFAVLHLSYGLGFLTGLVRFSHRWHDRTSSPDVHG